METYCLTEIFDQNHQQIIKKKKIKITTIADAMGMVKSTEMHWPLMYCFYKASHTAVTLEEIFMGLK